jgi:hypothetical protein
MVCRLEDEAGEEDENTKPVPGLDFREALAREVAMLRCSSEGVCDGKAVLRTGRMTCRKPRFPAEYIELRSIAV